MVEFAPSRSAMALRPGLITAVDNCEWGMRKRDALGLDEVARWARETASLPTLLILATHVALSA